jgi:hypothetical protein
LDDLRGPLPKKPPKTLAELWLYDGLREFVRRGKDWEALRKICAPWGTRRQLERLDACGRGAQETFCFAVLGDAEPGRFWFARTLFGVRGVFEKQLCELQTHGVDFVLQLGDMVSRGSVRNYLRFFRTLERCPCRIPYLSAIGNHDRRYPHGRSDAELYGAVFGPTGYWFERGAARFVVLDTSDGRLDAGRLAWLERVLDTDKRKAVFTHIPPAGLCAWRDVSGRRRGAGGFQEGGESFLCLMTRRKVDRVYFGHIHAFGVRDFSGVRYVLSGGGGSPLYPLGLQDQFYHYLRVEVGPQGFRDTVFCADGRSFEISDAVVGQYFSQCSASSRLRLGARRSSRAA